ncbi:DUF5105 domain-containing protein [Clostridium sp. YIM B02551]|uniref:DUF5105 domain-containing protein n=1 Tax=Clostridium sp. YIM B02551 TaxID=2910679 RepID=UPI001EEA5580|nr:DUF5105 domain-containing protein [Clostridium sp. YIM B02551]
MKKNFKVLTLSLAFIMSMALLISCSKKPTETSPSPGEYIKFYMDLAVKSEMGDSKKLGISNDEVKQFTNELDKRFSEGIASDASGIDKETLNKLVDSLRRGMTKIKYDINTVNVDKENAKVEIVVNPMILDRKELTPDKIVSESEMKELAKEYKTKDAFMKKVMELATSKMCKYFENPNISDEAKKITIDLKLENNEWKEVKEGPFKDFINNNLVIYK